MEELGIVWDTADAGFEQNLAAARAYHELHGTLAAPRGAAILDITVGQWLTNVRRPGRLGKDPGRAQRRAAALAAIDPTGTRERWDGRSTGNATTPTSPNSSPKAPARPPSCRE
ncbi:helicase associated domain-containing protein [Streptomyces virginiae]|uniref:helicase associated domain-containing protein n=1 Tax=Streptomyces virginiae TaxID=1961 RepID=UPI003430E24E